MLRDRLCEAQMTLNDCLAHSITTCKKCKKLVAQLATIAATPKRIANRGATIPRASDLNPIFERR